MLLATFLKGLMYFLIVLSLYLLDQSLGSGFAEIFQEIFCKIVCITRKLFRKDGKIHSFILDKQSPVNVFTLLTEVVLLAITVVFLRKYRSYRGKDRIDELLQESKEALRQTNEFLEKWRMRRLPDEYQYLDDDEDPHDIKPLHLEIPILHMAIIDTHSSSRHQPLRADAGDSNTYTGSAILSVAPLLDEIDSPPESLPAIDDNFFLDKKKIDLKNRYLYDVEEEDSNTEDI